MAAVCAATFMLLVDVTVVQVALPTIQRHLHSSFADLQWVIDAYALSLASVLLTCGSLADRYGRKRVFVIGLAVFTVASLLCGLAQSSDVLIWSRALQGLGGGAMFATGLALIGQDYHGADRGRAIAAWGATVGAAVAIGPLRRRHPHRQPWLAVDLFRQRADRDCDRRSWPPGGWSTSATRARSGSTSVGS